jgi:hypothetical protein
MLVLGYLYKMLWLFSLKYRELWTVGTLPLKRAFRAAKKKMKKFMKAGLRFSKKKMTKINERDTSGDEYDGEGGSYGYGYGVLDDEQHSHGSEDEWRSDEDGTESKSSRGKKREKTKTKTKKRKSLGGEEMYVREDGLMLFGVMQPSSASSSSSKTPTPSPSSQSHHSVLSALYRPEYLHVNSSPQQSSNTSSSTPTNPPTATSNATPRNSTTNSRNRIVVSKSQRGSGPETGRGGGSASTSNDSLHSSLRI